MSDSLKGGYLLATTIKCWLYIKINLAIKQNPGIYGLFYLAYKRHIGIIGIWHKLAYIVHIAANKIGFKTTLAVNLELYRPLIFLKKYKKNTIKIQSAWRHLRIILLAK